MENQWGVVERISGSEMGVKMMKIRDGGSLNKTLAPKIEEMTSLPVRKQCAAARPYHAAACFVPSDLVL